MICGNQKDVTPQPAPMAGAKGAFIQWLVARPEGAEHFYMRRIIVEEGGLIPEHSHPEVHEIYVLGGEGRAECDGRAASMTPGDFLFVPGGRPHAFTNTGTGPLTFICCINAPHE